MAQLINITSEALQATIRRLLPSQQGFGEDLQASNVITPIIDLTPSAEGSEIRADLQTAMALASQTAFSASGSTATVANTAGFWKVFANSTQRCTVAGGNVSCKFTLSDGISTKTLWEQTIADISAGSSPEQFITANVDLVVFLKGGQTLSAVSSNGNSFLQGSARQIATINGDLVNPAGFTPQ